MKRWLYISLLFTFPFNPLKAQIDTFVLKEYILKFQKFPHSLIGTTSFNLPLKNYLNISDALKHNSAMHIKEYGVNGLSTMSVRGMSAQHTAVYWNNFNLQSSMNGLIDLNLLPTFFIDQTEVNTSSSVSTPGAGSLAGALLLKSNYSETKNIELQIACGSFQAYDVSVGSTYQIKKWILKTRALYKQAQNNYQYQNYFKHNNPTERQLNNEFEQKGILQDFKYSYKKKTVTSSIWLLKSHRQLPTPIGIENKSETQSDFNFKFTNNYIYSLNNKTELSTKIGLFYDEIFYFHPQLNLFKNKTNNLILESDISHAMSSKLKSLTQFNYTFNNAISDGFVNGIDRHLFSFLQKINYQSKSKDFKSTLSLRIQTYKEHKIYPSPELGIEYQINSNLKIKSTNAYHVRIPNINDLHWQPGGNIQLKPEKGYKNDLTFEFKNKNLQLFITGFNHNISDWIMWTPNKNSSIWSPKNIKQVNSSGIESGFEWIKSTKNIQFIFNGRYQLVRSINTKTYENTENVLGKQLPYTPYNTGFVQLRTLYKKWEMNGNLNYSDFRFTTSDNSPEYILDSYYLINLNIAYHLTAKKHDMDVLFQINNIANKTYQTMENRPMPLRNYQLKINYKIKYDKIKS